VIIEGIASRSGHTIRLHVVKIMGTPMAAARALLIGGLLTWAILTPGFLSMPSLTALMSTASVIGCMAAGMTFITIGGAIMSFALGATAAASAFVFVIVLNSAGLVPALAGALVFGALVTGLQGVLVGLIRANPIIVSIAANILIYGAAAWLTSNQTAYGPSGSGELFLRQVVAGVPVEFIVFLALIALGQFILAYTVFGRNLLLVGSGSQAADALGLPVARTISLAYVWAGLFTAISGILLAVRYNQGNMSLAVNYDYDAIAAVLVGGTAIQGGDGSMLRTLIGVAVISIIQVVLLLHGFDAAWRHLVTGLIVLGVIVLYSGRRA
jgi:ribose/xylose/arabinose/galactoside ABC-type transport system permease subunit